MSDQAIEFPADEEWLELAVSPQKYVISTHGRYYSVGKKRILVANVWQPSNRLRVQVQTRKADGLMSSTTRTVALDVLTHFGADDGKVPERKSDVAVYADGDVRNCHIDNLSWARLDSDEHRANMRRIEEFDRGRMLKEARVAGEAAAAEPAPKKQTSSRRAESAKPGGLVTPDAVASALASRRTDKDLTPDESRAIRAWWVARGGNKRGRLPSDAIMAYDHENGRPVGVGA